MNPVRIPYLVPIAIGAAVVTLAFLLRYRDLGEARSHWQLAVEPDTKATEARLADTFSRIYEGLRTIARLPSVRQLDRYAKNLDDNARQTIQEIYNNLATGVAMSEVYIVPASLDADAVDPTTGKPQEPSITFDELILGRNADHKDEHAAPAGEAEHEPEVEEVEIFEYRLMQQQLARFRTICPDESSVQGLAYPALTGPEVVTCDNRYFSPKQPNDKDRSGLVYSVPIFGLDGQLRGCVSGVILTRALRECMPDGDYALRHAEHDYLAGSTDDGIWQQHLAAIHAGTPGDDLVYSRVLPLAVHDAQPGWQLWVGRPNEEFESSAEARGANATSYWLMLAAVALVTGLAFRERTAERRRREDEARRTELERARDAAESLSKARSNLVAITSHEIRTPMNGVLGMAELLLQSELQPEQRMLVESARQSARTLIDLLQGILEFSRAESGEIQIENIEFDLHELLEDVVQLLAPTAAQKSLEFTLLLGDGLPRTAIGDPTRLRQVATNLVGNAVKFTNQGSVTVLADWFVKEDEPLLCLRITDTGIGLDPSLRERVFEPFTQADSSTTRKFGGTGLGLAISRGLVEAMGGVIDYTPTPGGGTTFVVTLPLRLPTLKTAPWHPLHGRRLLMVSARPHLQSMLRHDLIALGAQVEQVQTAAEAQTRLADAAQAPQVLLLDRDLTGTTAQELLAWVGENRPQQPVVLLQSWNAPLTSRGEQPACVRAVLRTPASRNNLSRTLLRSLVEQAPAASEEPFDTAPAPVAASVPIVQKPATASAPSSSTPSATAAQTPAPTTTEHGHAHGNPKAPPPTPTRTLGRVLVVDDNATNLLVACMTLRKLGYETVEARHGGEALELFRKHAFVAILMDWQMPGMDGVEATRHIRELERQEGRSPVPILGVSANSFDTDRQTCLDAGMTAFLAKPVTSKLLAATLAELCPTHA